MPEEKITESGHTEWASPIFFAPEKGVKLRLWAKYGRLNALKKRNYYPIPRIYEHIHCSEEATVLFTFDANSGYQ